MAENPGFALTQKCGRVCGNAGTDRFRAALRFYRYGNLPASR